MREQNDNKCEDDGHLYRRIDGKQMLTCYYCGKPQDDV